MGLLDYIAKRAGRQAEAICRLAIASSKNGRRNPPVVQLSGDVEHPDFRDSIELVRSNACVAEVAETARELIVVAQSRPGAVRLADVERLQRRNPLAGMVALLGTWCEGETRTGRPWPGVLRLYWYEFPAWFRRQLSLRAAGRCPDWSQCDVGLRTSHAGLRIAHGRMRGAIQLCATSRETANVLSDVLESTGYATVWQRSGSAAAFVRGAVAGVWDGGQLDARESDELIAFCRRLKRHHAPVIAILDFPRRDCARRALQCGAAAVLGKPWRVEDLLGTIEQHVHSGAWSDGHANNRAA